MKNVLNYNNFLLENNNNFDFKKIFLELTEYTIPYGFEYTLEPILYKYIPNLKKDNFGNYHITIGNSKTLFTSHLDTYSKRYEKVNHIIEDNIIKTDGTTVLGGDNKNGVVILMYMIKNNVPGTYYFFKGEEGIVTGESCNGSTYLLENRSDLMINFDRAIAFDRRGEGSIVVKQRGRKCCSEEFSNALIEEFDNNNLPFKKDYAYGTDSAVFMDIIPEITNISSGGKFEHAFLEETDINYLEKIANAAISINWESLPTIRKAEPIYTEYDKNDYEDNIIKKSKITFKKVESLLGTKGFNCINSDNFSPNTIMQFTQYVDDNYINIKILGDIITIVDSSNYIKNFKKGTIEDLTKYFKLTLKDFIKGIIGRIIKKMNVNYEISRNDLNDILNDFMVSYDEFKDYIENSEYKDYFKFNDDKIFMDVKAGQGATIKRQQEQENKK